MAVTMASSFAYSYNHDRAKQIIKIAWDWNSGDGGEVGDTDGAALATTGLKFSGKIIGLGTIPDGGGEAYDLTIKDSDGHDVLLGAGLARHATNTEYVNETTIGGVANSTLTFGVVSAGSNKAGLVILWIDGYVG